MKNRRHLRTKLWRISWVQIQYTGHQTGSVLLLFSEGERELKMTTAFLSRKDQNGNSNNKGPENENRKRSKQLTNRCTLKNNHSLQNNKSEATLPNKNRKRQSDPLTAVIQNVIRSGKHFLKDVHCKFVLVRNFKIQNYILRDWL